MTTRYSSNFHIVNNPQHSVEIPGFFCHSDFTWNQFFVHSFKGSEFDFGQSLSLSKFKASKDVWKKIAVFELLESLHSFHVKSEWQGISEIFTLWLLHIFFQWSKCSRGRKIGQTFCWKKLYVCLKTSSN